jgi:hypothetical protein
MPCQHILVILLTIEWVSLDPSGCWYGFGKGRGDNLDDQIAMVLQLILHHRGFGLVRDDGHSGLVGPSRVPV